MCVYTEEPMSSEKKGLVFFTNHKMFLPSIVCLPSVTNVFVMTLICITVRFYADVACIFCFSLGGCPAVLYPNSGYCCSDTWGTCCSLGYTYINAAKTACYTSCPSGYFPDQNRICQSKLRLLFFFSFFLFFLLFSNTS